MPRIVPLQLLKCLKVLLDDNGGILSAGEVKRIAGLMTKYSKKLVSKCIYVQILKCTKTELLGEFMGVGGWTLVYTWLNDGIRAMNWPLVQEILELLLLCPVDVERLKINSAPKLVKGLCKDGGNEGVRILAKRLVEQWLKVVTETNSSAVSAAAVAAATPTVSQTTGAVQIAHEPGVVAMGTGVTAPTQLHSQTLNTTAADVTKGVINKNTIKEVERDPLGDVNDVDAESNTYTLTPAQKKASEAGLVYKIIIKNGQQALAKVPKTMPSIVRNDDESEKKKALTSADEEEDSGSVEADEIDGEADILEEQESIVADMIDENEEDSKTSTSRRKDSESSEEDTSADNRANTDKRLSTDDKKSLDSEKAKNDKEESKSVKESKEQRDKDRKSDKDKNKDHRSSSSSSHKSSSSSSSHKSYSSSSKSSSSSSNKSKSSVSSSSHRSSSDKHRSDKDRSSSSSSNKDKDRSKEGSSSSSSSSKHKSSSSTKSSSSSSSSSSSKDRHRDKDKEKTSSSSSGSSSSISKKDKEREKEVQIEKDKDTLAKMIPPSLDKLGKIPKKPKDETESDSKAPTSITIPSKKASMSIEIRRDTVKAKTVKTYKSQFRSHGLTEEAPPPPSRKGLKKPTSATPAGATIPTSLPSSIKRASPPPRDSPIDKKAKLDINNVTVINEKPGAIKLIAPKKIQTLVETNLFSDALSAATGPKKTVKRKRPTTASGQSKEGPSPPTSPDAPKVAPLKFYQDTLDESKSEERLEKDGDDQTKEGATNNTDESAAAAAAADKDASLVEDDDDIPLKKVKEDIEQKVLNEKKAAAAAADGAGGGDDDICLIVDSATTQENSDEPAEPRKPGPGCGPDGPPGVLMLHRRKGPKKKLSWRPQEHLEQIRYFELDETERVNVTKTPSSFNDMKNLERFSERDAINMSRRGFNHEDNMEPQTPWRALIEVDDVPPHPDGSQSKQRKIQADREMTTLRALYFSHAMIPDSPAEAEIEPHFAYDIPVIPLDDITGNPDAVNDFTSMPWPEPKGSPKHGDNIMAGTGGLGSPIDMFGGPQPGGGGGGGGGSGGGGNANNPFNAFMHPFNNAGPGGPPNPMQLQMQQNLVGPGGPQMPGWQNGPNNGGNGVGGGGGGMMGHPFNNLSGSPNMDMGPGQGNFMPGPPVFGPGGPPFMPGSGGGGGGGNYGPPPGFNGGPNFGPMGVGGPMGPNQMMNNMGGGPMNGMIGPGGRGNNNRGGNWRIGGGANFQDNNGGNSGGNWRSAGSGPNRGGGGGGVDRGGNNNNGICKAFMRGHCRLGKACKFIHPKSKRL